MPRKFATKDLYKGMPWMCFTRQYATPAPQLLLQFIANIFRLEIWWKCYRLVNMLCRTIKKTECKSLFFKPANCELPFHFQKTSDHLYSNQWIWWITHYKMKEMWNIRSKERSNKFLITFHGTSLLFLLINRMLWKFRLLCF